MYAWKKPQKIQPLPIRELTGVDCRNDEEATRVVNKRKIKVFYNPPNELPDFEKGFGNISATYAFGSQGAEVEVDTETGEVKILRLVAAHDVGRVLNPQALRGQMYGALAQGVGYALYENLQSHEGRILNPTFRDYKIPRAQEMNFPIDLEFIETDNSFGPFGAQGGG